MGGILGTRRYLWVMLLARLFESLPLTCPNCGADMRLIAFITEAAPVEQILTPIGEPPRRRPSLPHAPALRCPVPLGYQPEPSWFGRSLLQRWFPRRILLRLQVPAGRVRAPNR